MRSCHCHMRLFACTLWVNWVQSFQKMHTKKHIIQCILHIIQEQVDARVCWVCILLPHNYEQFCYVSTCLLGMYKHIPYLCIYNTSNSKYIFTKAVYKCIDDIIWCFFFPILTTHWLKHPIFYIRRTCIVHNCVARLHCTSGGQSKNRSRRVKDRGEYSAVQFCNVFE